MITWNELRSKWQKLNAHTVPWEFCFLFSGIGLLFTDVGRTNAPWSLVGVLIAALFSLRRGYIMYQNRLRNKETERERIKAWNELQDSDARFESRPRYEEKDKV